MAQWTRIISDMVWHRFCDARTRQAIKALRSEFRQKARSAASRAERRSMKRELQRRIALILEAARMDRGHDSPPYRLRMIPDQPRRRDDS